MERSVYEDMHALEQTHWWFRARRDILLDFIRQYAPAGTSLLDVGCGTGYMLDRLRTEYDVHGIDDSSIAVEICHSKGLSSVQHGILGVAPLGRESFNTITLLDVLEHVDEPVQVLRTARGMLAEDGCLLITVPALKILWSQHDVVHHHRTRYERATLAKVVTDAGFEPVRMTYFNSLLFPLVLAARMAGKLMRSAGSDAEKLPPPAVNSLLYNVFRRERELLRRSDLPVGVSLLCIARPSWST